MRISVTGANGFLGAKVVSKLAKEGHHVIEWVKAPSITFRDYRIFDLEQQCDINFDDSDVVIHCAAYLPLNYSDFSEDEKCHKINAIGTRKLIEAAIQSGVKKFIHISTGQLYRWNDSTLKATELDVLFPSERAIPYLLSKFNGEVYVDHYKDKIDVITLRPSYIYGPGMKFNGLLHRITTALKNNEHIDIKKIGYYKIDLVYVDDVVEMIYLTATKKDVIGVYNVGGGDTINTYELTHGLANIMCKSNLILESPTSLKNKMFLNFDKCHPSLNINKAINIGYKPTEIMIGLTNYVKSLK
jgi:UDP-glucose 4-epimerase